MTHTPIPHPLVRLRSVLASGRRFRLAFHACAAVLVACTYFAFRVELFDGESEAHERDVPHGLALVAPSLSWETFDKDNAPQAFTIVVLTAFDASFALPPAPELCRQDILPYQPVRDKSPPSSVSTL